MQVGVGLGFPSKFSLNEIRENEWSKFVHFVQNFRKFRCIYDEIFAQFSFDKDRNFSISHEKDCSFAKKNMILKEFRGNFERILQKFRTKKILTKIFVFAHIFVEWTKFSRKRLNENLKTLTGMQFSAEKMQEFKSTQF